MPDSVATAMVPAAATEAPSASERLERHLDALEPWISGLVERLRLHRLEHGDPEPWSAEQFQAEAERLEAWLTDPLGSTLFNDPQLLQAMAQQGASLSPTGCTTLEGLTLANIHDLSEDLQYQWAVAEAASFALDQGWHSSAAPRFTAPRGLMLHGIGSGRFLSRILERSQPDVVLLFESDFGRLLAALGEIDLAAMMAPFSGPGRGFFLITNTDPDQVFEDVTILLSQSNLFVLDALLVCDGDATEASAVLRQRFNAERTNMLIGYLGFFTDELHMLMNSTVNFRHLGASVLSPAAVQPHPHHAVIAASGPSLRQHLPLLAAEREHYTLFSGWSTLGSLLEAGIVPDYHCPMERHVVHDVLQWPNVAPHLSSIMLVGPTSLDPRQINSYADRLLIFRSGGAPTSVYAATMLEAINGEGPLTVNMAAIAAVLLGFRHLHFFGADFGTPDQGDKRSVDALLDTPYSFDLSEVGVAGAIVHTNVIMLDARRALERLLAGGFSQGDPVVGHNFSSGLCIKGAPETDVQSFAGLLAGSSRQPKPPASLSRRSQDWAEARWRLARLRERSLLCFQNLRALVEAPFEPSTLLAITDLANVYNKDLLDQLPSRLYRGTVFRTWFGLLTLHRRLQFPSPDAEAKWLEHCCEILYRVVDSLEDLSYELYDYLEDLGGLAEFAFESRRRSVS